MSRSKPAGPGAGCELELLVREGCHLCDEARAALREVAGEAGVELSWRETDIESDDDLLRRYLERIPVLRDGDRELCELAFGPRDVRAAIGSRAGRTGAEGDGY